MQEDQTHSSDTPKWWQETTIYQIYPRSFQDSNGDGMGDIPGIVQRLPYLKELGIRAVWLSPIFRSPMKDFGYDISDYEAVDPLFGNLEDLDTLIREAHALDIRVILDLVPNHTSDQHPWFIQSASSRSNAKRDWYIWKDAHEGLPPNNWKSVFGGSAWEWHEATGQFYYHAFLKEQPDLNWRNPAVQRAMLDTMRFWLDRGVDGFRVDVMWHMIKDAQFRNNPPNPDYVPSMADYEELIPVYSTDQPEVHEIVRQMRSLLDEYGHRMMIGEIYLPIHKLVTYYGKDNSGVQLPFNFMLVSLTWDALKIAAAIDEYEGALPAGAWPNWVLGNHDQPRLRSRIGIEQSRIAALLLLTLRGTPTIYYGEEIGMRDVLIPPAEIKDPQGLNMPGKNLSRDPARTPMRWDASVNAGFTDQMPWLRIGCRRFNDNVEVQAKEDYSMLSLYRRLLQLRNNEPSLRHGNYIRVFSNQQMLIYQRLAVGHDAFIIALNFSHRPCYFNSRSINLNIQGVIEISTQTQQQKSMINNEIMLEGDEGVVIRLSRD